LLTSLCASSIATGSHVEAVSRGVAAAAVHPLAAQIPARLLAHFDDNGVPAPGADSDVQQHLQQALMASGVFAPTTDASATASIEAGSGAPAALKSFSHSRS
jgi:hypothetical protein